MIQRFTYNQDGLPTPRDANWGALYTNTFDWQCLWHGARWQPMDFIKQTSTSNRKVVISQDLIGGLYTMAGGAWQGAVQGGLQGAALEVRLAR